jgi:hypothetical protein
MKFKLGLAIGAGAGYLVGSGKGREMLESVRRSYDGAGAKTHVSKAPVDSTPAGTESEMARRLVS